MNPRIDPATFRSSAAVKAMLDFNQALSDTGLERSLLELVKIRASQINGCAYCLHMHITDARANGEKGDRIYGLTAWREFPFYSERERAALAWTESVTLLAETHVPDELYAEVRKQFDEQEMLALTLAVVVINGWNRLVSSFRMPAGTYRREAVAV